MAKYHLAESCTATGIRLEVGSKQGSLCPQLGVPAGLREKTRRCRGCNETTTNKGWCSDACKSYLAYLTNTYGQRRYAATELRFFILKRDGYRCGYCKQEVTNETANIDHIKPWPWGKTTPRNLVTACRYCNKEKLRKRGFGLRRKKTGIVVKPRANMPWVMSRYRKGERRRKRQPMERASVALIEEGEELLGWLPRPKEA